MELALEHGVSDLLIWNDSQTPVHHVLGVYQVKMGHLKPIVQKTWELRSAFERFSIEWVPREETKRADALCRRIDPTGSGKSNA